MSEDKKISPSDLPQQWQRTTTQQPEEYIDKNNQKKDEDDKAGRPPGDSSDNIQHEKGAQESS